MKEKVIDDYDYILTIVDDYNKYNGFETLPGEECKNYFDKSIYYVKGLLDFCPCDELINSTDLAIMFLYAQMNCDELFFVKGISTWQNTVNFILDYKVSNPFDSFFEEVSYVHYTVKYLDVTGDYTNKDDPDYVICDFVVKYDILEDKMTIYDIGYSMSEDFNCICSESDVSKELTNNPELYLDFLFIFNDN